jgi:hypothetical protein
MLEGRGELASRAVLKRPPVVTRNEERQIFIERPRARRKPQEDSDKWLNSGGKKGSTEYWLNEHVGIRKRYGKCAPQDGGPPLRFMEFSILRDRADPKDDNSVTAWILGGTMGRDKTAAAGFTDTYGPSYVDSAPRKQAETQRGVLGGHARRRKASAKRADAAEAAAEHSNAAHSQVPPGALDLLAGHVDDGDGAGRRDGSGGRPGTPQPPPHAPPHSPQQQRQPRRQRPAYVATDEEHAQGQSVMALHTTDVNRRRIEGGAKFMSFMSEQSNGKAIELGSITSHKNGVKVVSSTGDFAEWHKRKPGERPFEEGDVVGFLRGGVISRRTKGARMLGVVSRRAVVEGSAPPKAERDDYDTVAYTGIVPIKVRRPAHPRSARPLGETQTQMQLGQNFALETGDVVVPSGRNDGTAVLLTSDAGAGAMAGGNSKRLGVVLEGCRWPKEEEATVSSSESASEDEIQLVTCAVTPPTETVAGGHASRHQGQCSWLRASVIWAVVTALLTVGAVLIIAVWVLPAMVKDDTERPPTPPPNQNNYGPGPDAFEISFSASTAVDDDDNTNFNSGTVGDTYRPSLQGGSGKGGGGGGEQQRYEEGEEEELPRWHEFLGRYVKTAQQCGGAAVYAKVEPRREACIPFPTDTAEDDGSSSNGILGSSSSSRRRSSSGGGYSCRNGVQVPQAFLYRKNLPAPAEDKELCVAAAKALNLTLGMANEYDTASNSTQPARKPSLEWPPGTGHLLCSTCAPPVFAGDYGVKGCFKWTSGDKKDFAFFSSGSCDLNPDTQEKIKYEYVQQRPSAAATAAAAARAPDGYWAVGVGSAMDRTKMDCANDCHQPQVFASRAFDRVGDSFADAVAETSAVASEAAVPAAAPGPWVSGGCENAYSPSSIWCSGHWDECSTEPGALCAPIETQTLCTSCGGSGGGGEWSRDRWGEWLLWDNEKAEPQNCPVPADAIHGRYCEETPISTAGGLGLNATWAGAKKQKKAGVQTVNICHRIQNIDLHDEDLQTQYGFTTDHHDGPIYCAQCTGVTVRDYGVDPASANWVATKRIRMTPV